MSLSDKECNIIVNKIDLDKYQNIGSLEIRGKETLIWEKGFFKIDVKEAVKELKLNKRFKQTGKELADELNLNDAKIIQKIQLMFVEILLEYDGIFGDKLI